MPMTGLTPWFSQKTRRTQGLQAVERDTRRDQWLKVGRSGRNKDFIGHRDNLRQAYILIRILQEANAADSGGLRVCQRRCTSQQKSLDKLVC